MLNLFKYNNRVCSSLRIINFYTLNNNTIIYSNNNNSNLILNNNNNPTTLLNGQSNGLMFYTKANHKYTRRASYTHQQDIKALKKREEKKEATQQHRDPVEFPHNKKAHEHTKPLSHQEKQDLKKKLKARRKEEIKKDNAERVKHIIEAEERSSLTTPATSVAASAAGTLYSQKKVNNIELIEDDAEDDQDEFVGQDYDDEFEDDEDQDEFDQDEDQDEDQELEEFDEEFDQEEDDDYRDQYEDNDLEEYEEHDDNEFDLDSIDPSKIIEVDAEMLKNLPQDDDGQFILPNFISFEDAKSKYGFTERELKDSAITFAAAEASRQIEAEKLQAKQQKSKKSIKQLEREASSNEKLVEEPEEEIEYAVDDSEITRKKQQKLDKSLRKQQAKVKDSTKDNDEPYESVEHFVREKHLHKLQSARGGQLGIEPFIKGPPKVSEIMEVLAETKLEDFCVIDVSEKCKWTKYMIVASSDSNRVILNAEEDLLEKFQNRLSKGHQPRNPTDDSDVWRVLDLEECLVHLFETSTREYYDLETLWITRRPIGSEEQSWDDEKTDLIAERNATSSDTN